jgi:hypothetical protein
MIAILTQSLKLSPEQVRLIEERDRIILARRKCNTLEEMARLNPRLMEINKELGI